MQISFPYLLFVENAQDLITAKTAYGIYYWRPELCLGQLVSENACVEIPIPKFSLKQAVKLGAKTLIIGIASFEGKILSSWIPILKQALENGLDIASGLHDQLNDIPELLEAAIKNDQKLIDLRVTKKNFTHATGKKRQGKRLLTIGTDCSVGKMFAALAIEQNMCRRGYDTDFRATGQTGILIAGNGLPFDAIKADFVAGAMESLSPDNHENHWDIIEGQGSILHPACGVILALLHGSQPDAVVMCHDINRDRLYAYPHIKMPDISFCLKKHLEAIRLTNPKVRCVGLSINTSTLSDKDAIKKISNIENKYQIPTVDPVRDGVDKIVDYMEFEGLLIH